MKTEDRQELKRRIVEEIATQKKLMQSLAEGSKPVAPDNAIGRLTRMEAINSKSISEANLNVATAKLARLETALNKVDQPEFGICMRCDNPIPHGRIMLIPEATLCVPCTDQRDAEPN